MSLFAQPLLQDLEHKIHVDLFAGAGGASVGYEWATGRQPDIAINHNRKAVGLHQANHPQTRHHCSDVFEVDPREACDGRQVGSLWASPDCTGFSRAKGSKPKREADRRRRCLAWVVLRWSGTVAPDVIWLENVMEFMNWTRLVGPPHALRECKKTKGRRFKRFVQLLRQDGYTVEWRKLCAADYGAATIRERLFLVARRDGEPIVWPAPTHAPRTSDAVATGRLQPWDMAANHIDFGKPMCSIFATTAEAKEWAKAHGKKNAPHRPLKDNSMSRIARGVRRFVINNPKPFLVHLTHKSGGDKRCRSSEEPLATITCANRGEIAIAAPFTTSRYGEREGQEPRSRSIEEPLATVVPAGNGAMLAAAFLGQNNGGFADDRDITARDLKDPLSTILSNSRGHHPLIAAFTDHTNTGYAPSAAADEPLHTITAGGARHNVVAAHIQRDFGTSTGHEITQPLGTITTDGGGKAALVYSFLTKYYGQGTGQRIDDPAATITTDDRFGLVTVQVEGEPRVITDVGMRMLEPPELFGCQGFPKTFIIDRCADGTKLTLSEQVEMVGNSVSPYPAKAVIEANAPHMIVRRLEEPKKARRAA